MRADNSFMVRTALLVGIATSLTMMTVKVLLYRPFLTMPGGLRFVIEPAVLLAIYGLLIVWATRSYGPLRHVAVQIGTLLGLIAGGLQVVHISLENVIDFGAGVSGKTTLLLMLCVFALWGIAGYRSALATGSFGVGALTGFWSAIVSMLITVMFGFAVELYLAMPRPHVVATWEEFKRSGWTDVHAFTIANTLDSAFSHLVIGPLIGLLTGALAGVIARLQRRQEPTTYLGSS